MASSPDLFVVCKSCGSEVSPYITECPYCGNRLRKRAPKLEKGGRPKEPKAPRRPRPSLGRLKPGEMPGVRSHAAGRPWAPALLVLTALLVTLGSKAGLWSVLDLVVFGPLGDRFWTPLTTSFVYDSTGYQVVALSAIFIFGWLLGRRHGAWAPLLVYVVACIAGFGAVVALDEGALAIGGNAPALGMIGAWAVRDLLSRRRTSADDDDSDMLGVLVFAGVLVLLPLALAQAHALAGLAGGLVGLVLGLVFARLRER